jgi:hypothetical protein
MTTYIVSSGQTFSSALGPSDVASVLSGGQTSGVQKIANALRRPTGAGRIAAGETARFKLLEVDGPKGADV